MKRTVKPIKFVIAVVLMLAFSGYCFAFDDGDFQYWNMESVSWKIADDWKMKLMEEFRWGDDASNPYYQHSDLGVTYSGLAEWLDLIIRYRQIFQERSGDWKSENRPYFGATVKFNSGDFKLSNRGTFSYRNREDADNDWIYRNSLTIKPPLKLTNLEIEPYLSDEIFVNFDTEEFNRNRLAAGFSLKLLKNLKGEMYYLWQRSKTSSTGKWSDTYVLGTRLNLSF